MLLAGLGKDTLDAMRAVMDDMLVSFERDGNVRAEYLTLLIAKSMVD